MPAGNYMPWTDIPFTQIGFPATQYMTVVNLTPHRFVLDRSRTHSYQMDTFDWDDIPQGKARQNTAEYTKEFWKYAGDDGGEAYYSIQGTNKKFEIRKRSRVGENYPRRTIIDLTGMGLGQREYLDPGKKTSVTLVITGSGSYGFQASLRHGQGNWMKGIYDVIKDRQMRHVIMPVSHDAGMSTISNGIKSVGTKENTQTQGLSIYNQLRAGCRIFDLRVSSVHQLMHKTEYSFWTTHITGETSKIAVGNTGESLDEVIRHINQFTSESPGEVIIFRVRTLIGMLELPADGPIYWNTEIVRTFFDKLKLVNYRCGNLDPKAKFDMQTASYFMDRNSGRGCVLFLLDDSNLSPEVPHDSPADGIYNQRMMDINDHWSNNGDTERVANDQVATWNSMNRGGNLDGDQFLISQWLVSANIVESTALSLQKIAILPTNPAFYWMGVNHMSPESFPTAVLMDYVGIVVDEHLSWDQTSAELYTWAVGMNLYMISENCDISKRRSPLLPTKSGGVVTTKRRSVDSAPQWNGIIYANGSVIDNPPEGLHPGRFQVLRRGSIFANGTTLQENVFNAS